MQGHVQATYENPPHVYALADNMYRNMTIGLRSMMMMMMIGMTWHMIMIIDFLTCENIDIDSLIQQRLMVIIFNVLHLYLKKTMQQKTVQIKKIIRWTFRQWEPMCDHLWWVWGGQDGCSQVHHGLHLQGDTHDQDEECDHNISRSLVVGNVRHMWRRLSNIQTHFLKPLVSPSLPLIKISKPYGSLPMFMIMIITELQ